MKKRMCIFLTACFLMQCFAHPAFAEEAYGVNIALNKPVWTNIFNGLTGFDESTATDGNIRTVAAVSAHTMENGILNHGPVGNFNTYLAVDLGAVYDLNRVIMRTRRDLRDEWCRRGFVMSVATKVDFSDAAVIGVKENPGEYESDLNVRLDTAVKGRYIIITNNFGTGGAFAIGEVEAYGTKNETAEGVFEDVTGSEFETAVRVVNHLGIMSEISMGLFGADYLVTRGEAAELAVRLSKNAEAEYHGGFKDVSVENEYAGWIAAALRLGIISQMEKYRPDEYISLNEFVTMMLQVNGYYKMIQDENWPENVVTMANQLRLLNNIGGSDEFLSRKAAAQIMYKVLISDYIAADFDGNTFILQKSENSYMEDLFELYLMEGIVNATGVSSLQKEGDYRNNYVKIGSKEYSCELKDLEQLLGYAVYFISDEQNAVLDIWVNTKKNNVVELLDETIFTTSKEFIEAEDGARNKRYKLSANAYFIKNGTASTELDYHNMVSENGSLQLIDFDHDGIYDVVKIYAPEIAVVSMANYNGDQKELVISRKNGGNLNLNYDKLSVMNEKGLALEPEDIAGGTLCYAYISDSGRYASIQVINHKVEGVITSIGEEYIGISGEDYKISPCFYRQVKDDGISLKDDGTFFLDSFDRVVYMTAASPIKYGEILGVITKCIQDEIEERIIFHVYDEKGDFLTLTAAEKLRVDGEKCGFNNFEAFGDEYFIGSAALVTVDSANTAVKILTDKSKELSVRPENIVGTRATDAGYFSDHTMVLPACKNTTFFYVPVDNEGKPLTGANYKKYYSVSTLAKEYTVNREPISNDKQIKMYGYDAAELPIAAIETKTYSQTMNFSPITNYKDIDALIVESCNDTVNSEDERVFSLTGTDISTGAKKTIITSAGLEYAVNSFKVHNVDLYHDVPAEYKPDSSWFEGVQVLYPNKINSYFLLDIADLKKGDIIRYSSRNSSEGVSQLEVVLPYDKIEDVKNKVFYSVGDLYFTIFSTFRLEKASVIECADGRIKLEIEDVQTPENIALENFGGKVLLTDGKKVESQMISQAEALIQAGDTVIIFSNATAFKSIIVY